jgi:hypothetical protein
MKIKRIRLEIARRAGARLRAQAPQRRRGGADTLRRAAALLNPQAVRAASLTRELAAAFVAGMAVALAGYRQRKQVAGGRRSEQTRSATSRLKGKNPPCSQERRSRRSSKCPSTPSRRNCGDGRSASTARCFAAALRGAGKPPNEAWPRRSIPDQCRDPGGRREAAAVRSHDVPRSSTLIECRFSHAANYDTG